MFKYAVAWLVSVPWLAQIQGLEGVIPATIYRDDIGI